MDEIKNITSGYKKQFIEDILEGMTPFLDNTQLMELNKTINQHSHNLIISENPNNIDLDYEKTNKILIKDFIKTKKLKGLSKKSLNYYETTLHRLEQWTIKSFIEMNAEDLKEYLRFYQKLNNCSPTSLNNIRRILSSFWNWLEIEEKILINPMKRIPSIKQPRYVRKAFTDEEIELLRNTLNNEKNRRIRLRNTAIFELFLSSGLRLSELTSLKKEDISLVDCKGTCLGKGNKERIFYFSERAKIALQEYLNQRTDTKEYLFVTINAPFNKLQSGGCGEAINKLGAESGITNVHPHRFRRTLATRLIRKGMPIEQVSKILGHENLSVTMRYVETDKELLRITHSKHTN